MRRIFGWAREVEKPSRWGTSQFVSWDKPSILTIWLNSALRKKVKLECGSYKQIERRNSNYWRALQQATHRLKWHSLHKLFPMQLSKQGYLICPKCPYFKEIIAFASRAYTLWPDKNYLNRNVNDAIPSTLTLHFIVQISSHLVFFHGLCNLKVQSHVNKGFPVISILS